MSIQNLPGLAAENAELRARLAEAEETLEAIRTGGVDESINEGAANVTPDGTILYCNRRFAEILGRPAEQIAGSSLQEHVLPEQQPALKALVAGAIHAGLGFNAETRRAQRGSTLLPFSLRTSALSASLRFCP